MFSVAAIEVMQRCTWHPVWGCCDGLSSQKYRFEDSVQKAQNKPSTQLINSTSYVEKLNATIKVREISNFSSYQTLTTEKHC
jgi:hypothetical protein